MTRFKGFLAASILDWGFFKASFGFYKELGFLGARHQGLRRTLIPEIRNSELESYTPTPDKPLHQKFELYPNPVQMVMLAVLQREVKTTHLDVVLPLYQSADSRAESRIEIP